MKSPDGDFFVSVSRTERVMGMKLHSSTSSENDNRKDFYQLTTL